jgi:hypothetical protein
MKKINYYLIKNRILYLFTFMLALVAAILFFNSCKEETIVPAGPYKVSFVTERAEDPLELLGIACYPDSLIEICDSIPSIDSMLVTLPDYPGCSFWLEFEYFECRYDSSFPFYHIGNYQLISHNCPAFTTAYNAALSAGGATLAAFVENFDHDVFLAIKTNLAASLVPPGSFPCGESYATFISYITVSCYKWCYLQIGPTVSSKRIACGSDCCAERTRACRDRDGVLVLTTSYDSDYPPYCTGPTIFDTGNPPGLCTSESECEYHCPQ